MGFAQIFVGIACTGRKVLRIVYQTHPTRKPVEQEVEVYACDPTRFEGYCRSTRKARLYRLDRVLEIEVLEEEFRPDPGWVDYFKKLGRIEIPLCRTEVPPGDAPTHFNYARIGPFVAG